MTPIDLSKWMIKVKQKCKILCLHALRSNESVMKMQISSWKKVLTEVADFHVINAPITNTGPPFPEIQAISKGPYMEWWNANNEGREYEDTYEYVGLQTTIDYLTKVVKEQGPFDGVLGYSQGAIVAHMLLGVSADTGNDPRFAGLRNAFRFGILIGPTRVPKDPSLKQLCGIDPARQCPLPTLLMIPTADKIPFHKPGYERPPGCFSKGQVLMTPGGHIVPKLKEKDDKLADEVKNFVSGLQLEG